MSETPMQQPLSAVEDDATLVVRAQRGDERAFATLYRRHVRYVAGALHRVLRRDEDVDDALQHAFADAHFGLSKILDPAGFRAWVTRIAIRRAYDRLAAERRRALLRAALALVLPRTANPTDRGAVDALQEALSRLHPSIAIPWILAEIAGHSIDEVANLCEISPSTAKRRIGRATYALERRLHAR
jgi:RNA polymerase sigma-70 factor, ECF subfamily